MSIMAVLLKRIISGTEESSKVLLEDSTEHNGRPLLRNILIQLAKRYDIVHVLLTDLSKDTWMGGLPEFVLKRIIISECLIDPLGWNMKSDKFPDIMMDMFQFPKPAIPSSSALIVDNLSTLLIYYEYTELCRTIQTLGRNYSTSYYLIHHDLCEDHVSNGLHHVMSSTIRMFPKRNDQKLLCSVCHKRKSGKILREMNTYAIENDNIICHMYEEKNKIEKSVEQVPIDPTANLTFDLRLTERQKQDRSRVILPYTQINKSGETQMGSGLVTYELDEVDDWDESDPDDDLDI